MRNPTVRQVACLISAVFWTLTAGQALQAEKLIIRTAKPYAPVVRAIEGAGGKVTHQYRYVNALAAELSAAGRTIVERQFPSMSWQKDTVVASPQVARDPDGTPLTASDNYETAVALDAPALTTLAGAHPQGYMVNTSLMNLTGLWANSYYGYDMKVAVIDSGIRPGFPHLSTDGSVIGGEDLVGDGLGYSNFNNEGHGTVVAGMISANVIFSFSPASTLLRSVRAHCPACVMGASNNQVPMVGSAPLSKIYALRIFAPNRDTPTSMILAAMERVIALRENYDNGVPEMRNPDGSYKALNVKVCNMSLGGDSIYAGRDVLGEMTRVFLQRDIVLVVSMGNGGPAGLTGGTPGTGFDALTVGAASSPIHERILRDVQGGLGTGILYRPFSGFQTAHFSSRGPTPDGRIHPNLVANGMASYAQGMGGLATINFMSGTSFSAPSVSGIAAVLREAVPSATARQIRNALIMTAKPGLIADGSTRLDYGAGFVDGDAAWALLKTGKVPDTPGVEGVSNANVKVNVLQGAGIPTYEDGVTRSVSGLLPGQRFETYFRVNPNTSQVIVTLTNLVFGPQQNTLFGDRILLGIHTAKTGVSPEGDYAHRVTTTGGTYVVLRPEVGLMRIVICGHWTNASPIGATVSIQALHEAEPQTTMSGHIRQGDKMTLPFEVPAGASALTARLEWENDWASYPTNDIDLYLTDPAGKLIVAGAMLNDPERVRIAAPAAGKWEAMVHGFAVFNKSDKYKLQIAIDDKVLR